jgi:hypothetical protein
MNPVPQLLMHGSHLVRLLWPNHVTYGAKCLLSQVLGAQRREVSGQLAAVGGVHHALEEVFCRRALLDGYSLVAGRTLGIGCRLYWPYTPRDTCLSITVSRSGLNSCHIIRDKHMPPPMYLT